MTVLAGAGKVLPLPCSCAYFTPFRLAPDLGAKERAGRIAAAARLALPPIRALREQ